MRKFISLLLVFALLCSPLEARRRWVPIIPVAGGGTPTISSVLPVSFANGDTGIVITGTNFGASQGAGTVKFSSVDNILGNYNPRNLGAGAQVVTNTVAATLSPTYPTGYTAVAGDVCALVIAGRPNGSTITNTATGYTLKGSQFLEVSTGANDLWVGVYTKTLTAAEAAPTVTPDSDFLPGSTTGGISAQVVILRDVTETLDVAAATNTSTAAATWTPPSVTTSTARSLVVSAVATADDNALNFNTPNGFGMVVNELNYDTVTGSDHAVGVGTFQKTVGGPVTMPVWNESAVGNDVWAGVTLAFQPVTRYGAIAQTVTAWSDTSITITSVKSTLLGGQNYAFVTNNSALSNASGASVAFTPLVADAIMWLDGASTGATVTGAILDAGFRGALTSGWALNPGTDADFTVATGSNRLHSAVLVSGVTYAAGSTANKRIALNNSQASLWAENSLPSNKRVVTASGFLVINSDVTNFSVYDPLILQGAATGQSVALQIFHNNDGVQHIWIESAVNFSTTHSSATTIASGTYWVSLQVDYNNGICALQFFETSGWTRVVNLTHTCMSGEDLGGTRFGNIETGAGTGVTYWEGLLYDWTNSAVGTPLGP